MCPVVRIDSPEKLTKGLFVLLGLPDDRGVGINHGRIGAAGGPLAIRMALDAEPPTQTIYDLGDVPIFDSQLQTYNNIADIVFQIHTSGAFPIILGGAHDLSFGSLSGFLKKYPKGGVINIDPHLDVREALGPDTFSSGTPFRNLLERTTMKGEQLMEFGTRLDRNSQEHQNYIKDKQVRSVPFPGNFEKELQNFAANKKAIAVSFDLDCIQSSESPGVSSLAEVGYSVEHSLEILRVLKKQKILRHFELMEMNPKVDEGNKTAHIAGRLLNELFRNKCLCT